MKYVQKYNIITPKFGSASAPPSTYLSTALITVTSVLSTYGFGMFTKPVYIITNCNVIVLGLLYTHQKPTLQISANIRSEMSLIIMVLYLNPGAVHWWPILANNGAPPISQQDGECCSNTT